jgi:hypothetical protein
MIRHKEEEYSPLHEDWSVAVEEACEELPTSPSSSTSEDSETRDFHRLPGDNTSSRYIDVPEKSQVKVIVHTEDELLQAVRTLNARQRAFLDHVSQALRYNRRLKVFLSGAAGVGKSRLVNAIDMLASSFFFKALNCNDQVTVLKLAPTGMAAFHIGGSTAHSALRLPIGYSLTYIPMNNSKGMEEMRIQCANV